MNRRPAVIFAVREHSDDLPGMDAFWRATLERHPNAMLISSRDASPTSLTDFEHLALERARLVVVVALEDDVDAGRIENMTNTCAAAKNAAFINIFVGETPNPPGFEVLRATHPPEKWAIISRRVVRLDDRAFLMQWRAFLEDLPDDIGAVPPTRSAGPSEYTRSFEKLAAEPETAASPFPARPSEFTQMLGAPAARPPASHSPPAPVQPKQPPETKTLSESYEVWFGTNRRPTNTESGKLTFGAQRDQAIHVGRCVVEIPKSHRIGSLGSPWWKRWLMRKDDRLRLVKCEAFREAAFWQSIARKLKRGAAVVFVHGYNVSFDEAARRAAQIGFDLSVRGPMAFFSWPSKGELRGYPADEATIEWSADDLRSFLIGFATRAGASNVHIIAHSMGNRAVLNALSRIAADASVATGIRFGQIILAAADVDVGVFKNLCEAYKRLAIRTTMYVSQKDFAVEASETLHAYPRVGKAPPVTIVDGIDTVSVSDLDLSFLGHGYVAEARPVLQDIYELLSKNTPPSQRFGLVPTTDDQSLTYWTVKR